MLTINNNKFDQWELLLKVLSSEISEDDSEFQCWLGEHPDHKKLYHELKEKEYKDRLFDKDKIFHNICDKLSLDSKNRVHFYQLNCFKYAVSFVAVILVGLTGFYFTSQDKETPVLTEKTFFNPGTKKAFLLSEGGETIDLSQSFEVKKKDGTIITNESKGVISFQKDKQIQKTKRTQKTIEEQTIYVPKGGEYELILADSSKVYLNSETQLIFPSSFEGKARQVELSGEAYFEVKKGTKPFIIKTTNMSIEVLGTSFNVNAYETNPLINTTLVKGSIQVHLPGNPEPILLTPENNLCLDKSTHKISIQKVNPDLYTAWIKGEFIFRNQPLTEIFDQLTKWYDFTIIYENQDIRKMRFTGSAEKSRSLDFLLNQIRSVTEIKYKNEGNKIILYK
ncbi:MAG: FecR family protein [Bacilli bacterium]|nr:FecR family protein [Bacilli bacterium]